MLALHPSRTHPLAKESKSDDDTSGDPAPSVVTQSSGPEHGRIASSLTLRFTINATQRGNHRSFRPTEKLPTKFGTDVHDGRFEYVLWVELPRQEVAAGSAVINNWAVMFELYQIFRSLRVGGVAANAAL